MLLFYLNTLLSVFDPSEPTAVCSGLEVVKVWLWLLYIVYSYVKVVL